MSDLLTDRIEKLETENARLRSLLDGDPELDGPAEEIAADAFQKFAAQHLEGKRDGQRLDWLDRVGFMTPHGRGVRKEISAGEWACIDADARFDNCRAAIDFAMAAEVKP